MKYFSLSQIIANAIGIVLLITSTQTYALSHIQLSAEHVDAAELQLDGVMANIDLSAAQAKLGLKAQLRHPELQSPVQLTLQCVSNSNALGHVGDVADVECKQGLLMNKQVELPFTLRFTKSNDLPIVNIKQAKMKQEPDRSHYLINLQLRNAKFADASGMHAAENLNLTTNVDLQNKGQDWQWTMQLNNEKGEIFWQPFYVSSHGITVKANGAMNADTFSIDDADVEWQSLGSAHVQGKLDRLTNHWQTLSVQASKMDVQNAYNLAKPLLENTLLSDVEIEGKANMLAHWQTGTLQDFHVNLRDMNVEDKQKRFAWYGLNADLPWGTDKPTLADVHFTSGKLLRIPLGETHLQANVNHYAVTADHWRFPILDGALVFDDVSAATLAGQWFGHLQATVMPIDMAQLSHELGWPRMEGKVAASIPKVTYADNVLTTSGELGFNVFDGHIIVQHLSMQSPLGQQPTLDADLTMRGLDLGALTRTFSFGAIEGRMDGEVSELQLVNWQPVHFNAQFQTSAGRFEKKISQRAVENISALGGAGAAAAIQRSFLRFFKEFNYEKIGLSCRLRGNVCEMNGLESTAGGYTIVKGSGIPSMTVMGYNHSVSWNELLERIQSAIAGNASPVIR